MDSGWRGRWLLLGCCGCAGFVAAAGDASSDVRYLSYSGTAVRRHSADFLYGETHVLEYRAGRLVRRVVLYTCGNGAPFARKTVSYVEAHAPDFELDDASNGMTEGVRSDERGRWVFFRGNRTDPEQVSPLPTVADLVVDAGFDEFLRGNWQRLMAGQMLSMPFLVPGRLRDMRFQVLHLRADAADGAPAEVFRLRLSGLWGYLVPDIDVYYAAADRVLVRYVGLTDLRNASNENFQAEITFPRADRSAADAALFDRARQAPLAPCS